MDLPRSPQECPRIVIGGVSSHVGKTTVTAGLARALKARGLRVQTFKCGPDYLDPTYHQQATGRPCHTLDPWMMGEEALVATFLSATHDADIALIEGVMGLFDGRDPESDAGSTAEVARWLDAPVCLVLDATGMGRSIRALVDGFRRHDPLLRVPAVVANRVGSAQHAQLLARALPEGVRLFFLPRDPEGSLGSRHLGLVPASESAQVESALDRWAARIREGFDLDALLALAGAGERDAGTDIPKPPPRARHPKRCRIGVAQDAAFSFYYPSNLEALARAWAELVPFSPLADAELPDLDGLYLGGGYPELHAPRLTANASLRSAVRAFAERGGPVYAECGGLMYLTQGIRTLDGCLHPMVGLFAAEAHMHATRRALGYREVTTVQETPLGPAGLRLRGHEFRYSELAHLGPLAAAYEVRGRLGGPWGEGYRLYETLASYVHVHWGRSPHVPAHFVERCVQARSNIQPP